MSEITREAKRACIQREIKMRKRVYPGWVARGRMTDGQAATEIATMEAILQDYTDPGLFDDE